MGAALSVVLLFAVSSTVVRVMSVVLEHTGVPQSIARLQALSAFSGTGFTTTESEMLLQTPERRRILVILMVAGSVGLASIVATILIGALGVANDAVGITKQLFFMIGSLVFVRYVIFAGTADKIVCSLAHAWLLRQGFDVRSYVLLHWLGEDCYLAEHWVRDDLSSDAETLASNELQLIGMRQSTDPNGAVMTFDESLLDSGLTILAIGGRESHNRFAAKYGSLDARGGH